LFDEFRAEQEQTERFLADTLETLTRAAVTAAEDHGPVQSALGDSQLEQLIAAGEQSRAAVHEACQSAHTQAERFAQATAECQRREEELLKALEHDRDALRAAEIAAQSQLEQLTDTIRKGFEELLSASRQRGANEQAFQASLTEAIQHEREATQQAIQAAVGQLVREFEVVQARTQQESRVAWTQLAEQQRTAAVEVVETAVAGVLERVVGQALEEQASMLARGLEEHRSMMGLAVEALRNACEGLPAEGSQAGTTPTGLASDSGTEASQGAGAARDSRTAPVSDAVLDSIRAQYQLVQRQNARRRKPNPESGA
jgi:hypothetical protein